ncbi:MAG: hypothetical protein HOO10_11055 [Candidatus Marinimicrobia bacterium]|jgi:hypothetical protein|nr:hypothetical protein [Candidatus Neomarinimicrobiota bacterium]
MMHIFNKIRKVFKKIISSPLIARIRQYVFVREIMDYFIIKKNNRNKGSKIIPYQIKQFLISHYQLVNSINTLIETGTYKGNTIHAFVYQFKNIYSFELDYDLWRFCKARFRKHSNVHLIRGDSSIELPKLLENINDRVIFWLDGHYSGPGTARGNINTPVIKELHSIKNHFIKNHIILIDDAQYFIGLNDYPTIKKIKNMLHEINPQYTIKIKYDIIMAY